MRIKQFKEVLIGNKFDEKDCVTVHIVTTVENEKIAIIPFGSNIRNLGNDGSTITTTGYVPEKQACCMIIRDFVDEAHQKPCFGDVVIFPVTMVSPELQVMWAELKQLLIENEEL